MLFADFPNSKFWFPKFVSSYAWHVTFFFLAIGLRYFFHNSNSNRLIYSKTPRFACLRWLFWDGADLIKLFSLLHLLRTGRTQIKDTGNICAGVLHLLHLPRWCRQNSHVTCSKTSWHSTAFTVVRYFSVFPDRF